MPTASDFVAEKQIRENRKPVAFDRKLGGNGVLADRMGHELENLGSDFRQRQTLLVHGPLVER
jgi:hypothetical protein